MNFQIDITFEGDHILAKTSGEDNYQVSLEIWMRIAKVCREHDCYKVLGISDMSNPVTVGEAYDHQLIFLAAGINARYRIAWVEINPESRELAEHIEPMLRKQFGITGKIFKDEKKAKKWLLSDKD